MQANCAPTLMSEIAPPTAMMKTATTTGRPIQVLLVEDETEAAELVLIRLAGDGREHFRVEWIANLRDAMDRLNEPGIDVVLLDLGMPELSGYKSFRAVRASAGYKLPIVVLTSDDRSISRDLVMQEGAAEYLLKNASSTARLRLALHTAVARARFEQSSD